MQFLVFLMFFNTFYFVTYLTSCIRRSNIPILCSDSDILAISGADDVDDKSKHPLVQRKGRFKVMSDNIDLDKIS